MRIASTTHRVRRSFAGHLRMRSRQGPRPVHILRSICGPSLIQESGHLSMSPCLYGKLSAPWTCANPRRGRPWQQSRRFRCDFPIAGTPLEKTPLHSRDSAGTDPATTQCTVRWECGASPSIARPCAVTAGRGESPSPASVLFSERAERLAATAQLAASTHLPEAQRNGSVKGPRCWVFLDSVATVAKRKVSRA